MSPLSEKLYSRKKRIGKFLALDGIPHGALTGVHTFSDKWAVQCLIFVKLSPAKSVSVDCIWPANERQRLSKDNLSLSVKTDLLFVNQSLFFSIFFVYMKDVSQTVTCTLITTSKLEEDGRSQSRCIQVYTVLFWKATLFLEGGLFRNFPILFNKYSCQLKKMILYANLVQWFYTTLFL